MRIRIVNIDFAKSATTIEVTPGHPEATGIQLRSFVSRCRALGLKKIRLYYHPDTPKGAVSRLQQICSGEKIHPPEPTPAEFELIAAARSGRIPRTYLSTDESYLSEYQVSFHNFDTVINDLTTTVMLINDAADLDPRSHFKLRLSIYELVVNTVSASYADNATVFMADITSAVDIVEEQIKSISKRGLGLFLLNNVCENWKYVREGDWNITTFSLEISRDTTPATER